MQRVELTKKINAPRELLWEAIVDPDHYKVWTATFQEGSAFDGDWSKGSRIDFYLETEEGSKSGMISEIAESTWPEFISIRHLGLIKDGVIDTDSDEAKKWAPAYENYTFESIDDASSQFIVAFDVEEENKDMFVDMWEKALVAYADLCESLKDKPVTITLKQHSNASPEAVWTALTIPEHVKGWNFAHESWYCPEAKNELKPGGEYHYIMSARDGSASFDFWGTFDEVIESQKLTSHLGDGRSLDIRIIAKPDGCLIEERFHAETENNLHLQRGGWAAILKNLAEYAATL